MLGAELSVVLQILYYCQKLRLNVDKFRYWHPAAREFWLPLLLILEKQKLSFSRPLCSIIKISPVYSWASLNKSTPSENSLWRQWGSFDSNSLLTNFWRSVPTLTWPLSLLENVTPHNPVDTIAIFTATINSCGKIPKMFQSYELN